MDSTSQREPSPVLHSTYRKNSWSRQVGRRPVLHAIQSGQKYVLSLIYASSTHQISQLRDEYFVVLNLKSASGFSWSDSKGAGKEKSDPEWKAYVKVSVIVLHGNDTHSSYNVDTQMRSAFQRQRFPYLRHHGGDDALKKQGHTHFSSWQQTLRASVFPSNKYASPCNPKYIFNAITTNTSDTRCHAPNRFGTVNMEDNINIK